MTQSAQQRPYMPPEILRVDTAMADVVGGIDILKAIAPLNFADEKQAFFDSNHKIEPQFVYREHSIDTLARKRALLNVPIESLQDEDLANIYRAVQGSYLDKIDQFSAIGSEDFLYDSLRYYGEPTEKDLRNAQFILHLPDQRDPSERFGADQIQTFMRGFADQHGYEFDIEIDSNMIANALVTGTRLKINGAAQLTKGDLAALAHHELGVHLVSTLNARAQPLRVFSLGFPRNTLTQEGLAILCEYLSGNLSINRLKNLALRVVAVKSLVEDKSFSKTFGKLREDFGADAEQAFAVTARVFRGGGFTKDCLYLKGFHELLNAHEKGHRLEHLLVGKTSHRYLSAITRLIEKGLVAVPTYISPALEMDGQVDDVSRFIAHAIR